MINKKGEDKLPPEKYYYVDVAAEPTKEVTTHLLPVQTKVALSPTAGILTAVFEPPV